MTNRIDYTLCTHSRTAKGRAWCRDNRKDAVRKAQQAYDGLCKVDTPAYGEYNEYYALVDHVAYVMGIDLTAAYDVVENGPVVR